MRLPTVQYELFGTPEEVTGEKLVNKTIWNLEHAQIQADFYTVGFSGKEIPELGPHPPRRGRHQPRRCPPLAPDPLQTGVQQRRPRSRPQRRRHRLQPPSRPRRAERAPRPRAAPTAPRRTSGHGTTTWSSLRSSRKAPPSSSAASAKPSPSWTPTPTPPSPTATASLWPSNAANSAATICNFNPLSHYRQPPLLFAGEGWGEGESPNSPPLHQKQLLSHVNRPVVEVPTPPERVVRRLQHLDATDLR